jgi:hypothetical protein
VVGAKLGAAVVGAAVIGTAAVVIYIWYIFDIITIYIYSIYY